jgi:hypothetical protein
LSVMTKMYFLPSASTMASFGTDGESTLSQANDCRDVHTVNQPFYIAFTRACTGMVLLSFSNAEPIP